MYSRDPIRGGGGAGLGGGMLGTPPREVLLLLGIVLATFSLQFFESTRWITEGLRLTPAVWQRGFLWQLVTYPFAGVGAPGFWFLLELLILYMFGKDVFNRLGSRRFWRLLIGVCGAAAVLAVVLQLVGALVGWVAPRPFLLMQGQRMLLVVLIAAFATIYQSATIYLFFVLPIQARWFLWLELLFAFLGFLGTHDLPGFLGICAAVGSTWVLLSPGPASHVLRRSWISVRQRWLKLRLDWLRRRRGIRLVEDEKKQPRDPWVH